ncbi:unnamed protein product [Rotaria magnacalcarata]|uniref:GIY-YIG domain-containing protein n=1 Tax=Rotaria magnacalcarata TaxID=392030 RepID=A0A8S2MHV5_9BILA|nr:unnamed protein product [Rotaria magnacalcarata]
MFGFKSQTRLCTLLNSTYRDKKNLSSQVIYQYNCKNCKNSYIGQTSRDVEQRKREHQNAFKGTGMSKIADHCNDDYICNACEENFKKKNRVQPHNFHTQEQHQTHSVLLENKHMNYEHVDNTELTEEDVLDLALGNISEESNDSSKEPSSIAQYSTSQRTSYENNIGEISVSNIHTN